MAVPSRGSGRWSPRRHRGGSPAGSGRRPAGGARRRARHRRKRAHPRERRSGRCGPRPPAAGRGCRAGSMIELVRDHLWTNVSRPWRRPHTPRHTPIPDALLGCSPTHSHPSRRLEDMATSTSTVPGTDQAEPALRAGAGLMTLAAVAFIGYGGIFLVRNFSNSSRSWASAPPRSTSARPRSRPSVSRWPTTSPTCTWRWPGSSPPPAWPWPCCPGSGCAGGTCGPGSAQQRLNRARPVVVAAPVGRGCRRGVGTWRR
jgi:hypothetical protein